MQLKYIKLIGFKSFVDLTKIVFPSQLSAIVGPNGCGKSNIIDAIKWVLGESNAKQLRGDMMTDVIFNGSSSRRPVSIASVELVFNNEIKKYTHHQYTEFNEISVKRVVNRDSQSDYFLNNNKCRRKDITDLFSGTGLGPRSYSIIGQGMISQLIESKPQELRHFIEEAAGISKYKARRKETENKIHNTKENLDRIQDIKQEINEQVSRLKRQADAAKRYKQLKKEEIQYQHQYLALKWKQHQEMIEFEQEKIHQLQAEKTQLENHYSGEDNGIVQLENQKQIVLSELDNVNNYILQHSNLITKLEQQIIQSKERTNTLTNEIQRNQQKLLQANDELESLSHQKIQLNDDIEELTQEQETFTSNIDEINEIISEYHFNIETTEEEKNVLQQQVIDFETQDKVFNIELQNKNQQSQTAQQQLDLLEKEQENIKNSTLTMQIEEIQTTLHLKKEAITQLELKYSILSEKKDNIDTHYQNITTELLTLKQTQSHLQTQKKTLNTFILSQTTTVPPQYENFPRLYETWTIKDNWEHMIITLLHQFSQSLIIEHGHHIEQQDSLFSYFTDDKNTEQLNEATHPQHVFNLIDCPYNLSAWFHHIYYADDEKQAQQLLTTLPIYALVILKTGHIIGHGFNAFNIITTENNINTLKKEYQYCIDIIDNNKEKIKQLEEEIQTYKEKKENIYQEYNITQSTLQQHKEDSTALTIQFTQLQEIHKQQQQSQQIIKEKITLLMQNIKTYQQDIHMIKQQQQQNQSDSSQERLHFSEVENTLIQQRNQLKTIISEKEQLQINIQKNTTHQEVLKNQLHNTENNYMSRLSQQQEWQERIEESQEALLEITDPLETLNTELQETLESKIEYDEQKTVLNQQLDDLNVEIKELSLSHKDILQHIKQIENKIHQHQLEHEKNQIQANNQIELLHEHQGILKDILPLLSEDTNIDFLQKQLEQTKDRIKRLGAINLAAIDEYEEQFNRQQTLENQSTDLIESLSLLETAIKKIDKDTRELFKKTFDDINSHFQTLFPLVFEGGSAYLALTDDNLLDTGVTIMARPPGKKNSTIHLLSGGEKALTALALVFSIFQLNPAPFCILDEVDAPLDDANVNRFCKLVKKMSHDVQFIYITHNKVTMEIAQNLTGVTMHEPGVSRIVAVNLEEASKMVVTA